MNWKDKVILVTGGTGSFGKKFTEIMLKEYQPKKIIIFSRDELKQHEMRVRGYDHPSLRYFIGDVRDRERLVRAMHGVDIVVHAAALNRCPPASTTRWKPSRLTSWALPMWWKPPSTRA